MHASKVGVDPVFVASRAAPRLPFSKQYSVKVLDTTLLCTECFLVVLLRYKTFRDGGEKTVSRRRDIGIKRRWHDEGEGVYHEEDQ